ncbi:MULTISPECIES: hypothetical protein [unclassified Olleya]|jgi:hypothetical protein|uniref:hypothetical protein n=1 Tax=unclassified Olleya TaxID=2615019 RepID=UPI0011A04127|nr:MULTISPECIES: hypothetical protein [unclassified Olleya]TVZ47183.1 hypothetical protein JM82_1776 [Olleya sp. Hel_I_94]|tara:strand:+ start:244124 stop:244345 length:222 start_codon:yes stop_codon:yes gene_type:complete
MLEQLKFIYLIIALTQIAIGTSFVFIGFKIIKLFKNKPQTQHHWYTKYQTTFKVGGLILIIFGSISLPFFNLI